MIYKTYLSDSNIYYQFLKQGWISIIEGQLTEVM
jgi:hypothetical protein